MRGCLFTCWFKTELTKPGKMQMTKKGKMQCEAISIAARWRASDPLILK